MAMARERRRTRAGSEDELVVADFVAIGLGPADDGRGRCRDVDDAPAEVNAVGPGLRVVGVAGSIADGVECGPEFERADGRARQQGREDLAAVRTSDESWLARRTLYVFGEIMVHARQPRRADVSHPQRRIAVCRCCALQ